MSQKKGDYSRVHSRVHNEKSPKDDHDQYSCSLTAQSSTSTAAGTKKRAAPKGAKSDSTLSAHGPEKPDPAKAKSSRKRKQSSSDDSDSDFEKLTSKASMSKVFIAA